MAQTNLSQTPAARQCKATAVTPREPPTGVVSDEIVYFVESAIAFRPFGMSKARKAKTKKRCFSYTVARSGGQGPPFASTFAVANGVIQEFPTTWFSHVKLKPRLKATEVKQEFLQRFSDDLLFKALVVATTTQTNGQTLALTNGALPASNPHESSPTTQPLEHSQSPSEVDDNDDDEASTPPLSPVYEREASLSPINMGPTFQTPMSLYPAKEIDIESPTNRIKPKKRKLVFTEVGEAFERQNAKRMQVDPLDPDL